MARDIFRLEWDGLDQLVRIMEEMNDEKDAIIIEEYTRFGLLVEEGTKALAPHDKGDLEDTIHSEPAKRDGDGISTEVYVGSEYGVYQHELVPRSGEHPKYENGAKFPGYYKDGKGARTRSKPGWRGEEPGRKYLERAVELTDDDFTEMNERALDRITQKWGG